MNCFVCIGGMNMDIRGIPFNKIDRAVCLEEYDLKLVGLPLILRRH